MSLTPPRSLTELVNNKVILILGSGGVGKTTSAIALACAAARQGKKVALLSIDPAKRLASALGIPLGSDLAAVQVADLKLGKGSLHAAMLDQKAVFDQLVAKFAVSKKVASAIYANKLYQAASSSLGGPLEYLALAKLALVDETQAFDLIVVDTPPDTHALDFLQRPNLLNGFMENKVMTWLLKPFVMAKRFGLSKLLTMGERLMGSIASVTGVQALEALAEFLVLIQDVIEGFHGSGERVVQMLRRSDTALLMVGAGTRASQRSMAAMAIELEKLGYRLNAMLLNRFLSDDVARTVASASGSNVSTSLSELDQILAKRYQVECAVIEQLQKQIVAKSNGVAIFRVPELSGDMQCVQGLTALVDVLERLPAFTIASKA